MRSIFFPPEWTRQSMVQLTWPHPDSDWNYMLEEITSCFVSLAQEILKRQTLLIVCNDTNSVRLALENIDTRNLILAEINSNDTWARDHSSISVFINGEPYLLDFTFNGWGLKFRADLDNQINKRLYSKNIFAPSVNYANRKNFVLEGGAIETDGKGTLLTTTECLLSPNRNAYLSKNQIESYLKQELGVNRVLWLDNGFLSGDDTDSHIDTLARFCNEQTIAYVKCYDKADEHYDKLSEMENQLKTFTDFENNPYKLIPLPLPDAIYDEDGTRLPATYANFLIMNDAVLLPVYDNNAEKNEIALNALREAFPSREIVPVNCTPIIQQHGSLHCVTMQYPERFN